MNVSGLQKGLSLRDVLLLYFKECRRRPVVKVLDKHACKTKQMILAAHKRIRQLKINEHNVHVRLSLQIMSRVNNHI